MDHTVAIFAMHTWVSLRGSMMLLFKAPVSVHPHPLALHLTSRKIKLVHSLIYAVTS